MIQAVNFKWPQGEDLNIQLVYREGDSINRTIPLNLATNYSLRMDLVHSTTRAVLYSYISTEHSQTLRSGTDKKSNINIFLPRSLTLPNGVLYSSITSNPPGSTFMYDIFLRNTVIDKQVKILKGAISIESSNTLWA